MGSETIGQNSTFEDQIAVMPWRPTLNIQRREGSSTFCIPDAKNSSLSVYKKILNDLKETESPREEALKRKLQL